MTGTRCRRHRDAVKVARLVLAQLECRRQAPLAGSRPSIGDLAGRIERLARLDRQLQEASRRGWSGASRRLLPSLEQAARNLRYDAASLEDALGLLRRPAPETRMADILADLGQLEAEYGGWSLDHAGGTLSVTTESIQLEGVELGAFEIRLSLARLTEAGSGRPIYSVVALDPNPAHSRADVTHPHVAGERLCEGDAELPIRHALQQGRLADFYMLVTRVLKTYNSHSPHVSLDDWDGLTCDACGIASDHDDHYTCSGCGDGYCPDCSSDCNVCDDRFCETCLKTCGDCRDPVCSGCRSTCDQCDGVFCSMCLDEGICRDCHETIPEEQDDEESKESPQPTAA